MDTGNKLNDLETKQHEEQPVKVVEASDSAAQMPELNPSTLEELSTAPVDPPPNFDLEPKQLTVSLNKQKGVFVYQGLRHVAIGLFLVALPILFYARIAGLSVGSDGVDTFLKGITYGLVPMSGVLELAVGLLILAGGIAFVERAKTLSSHVPVTLLLSRDQRKPSMDGTWIFSATVTYADERSESFKVSGMLEDDFNSIVDYPVPAVFFGAPFSANDSRYLVTECGTLLPLASEAALFNSLGKKSDSTPHSSTPLALRMRALWRALGGQCLLLVALIALLSSSASSQLWFLYTVYGVGMLTILLKIVETRQASKQLAEGKSIDCSTIVTLNKKKFFLAGVKARVLPVGSTESTEYILEASGGAPSLLGQPVEAKFYKSSDGKTMAISAPGMCLFSSKLDARLRWIPALVYILLLPFAMSSLTAYPENANDCKTANQFYERGVEFKDLGWTEKSRAALTKAITMDPDGDTGKKASKYMRTKLPVNNITDDAEKMNIQAFNLIYRDQREAETSFRAAIAKYPNFEWPYSNLGSMLCDENKLSEGIPLLKKALEINPNYVNALRHMVNAQLKAGNRQEAKQYLEQAIQADPDDALLRLQQFALSCSI